MSEMEFTAGPMGVPVEIYSDAEELGESLVLSLALGYVCGLVTLGPAWLRSAPRTDRVLQLD